MLSHERVIPHAIAKINPRTRVPSRSIVATGLISILFLLMPIELVATAASFIFMIVFGVVNIAAVVLVEEKKKKIISAFGVILIVLYIVIWVLTQFR